MWCALSAKAAHLLLLAVVVEQRETLRAHEGRVVAQSKRWCDARHGRAISVRLWSAEHLGSGIIVAQPKAVELGQSVERHVKVGCLLLRAGSAPCDAMGDGVEARREGDICLLYTSPSPRDS